MITEPPNEPEDRAVFRMRIRTWIGEALFGGVLAVLSLVGSATVAAMSGVLVGSMLQECLGASTGVAVGVGLFAALPVFAIVLWRGSQYALSRFRTTVEVGASSVSIGRGLLRQSFECSEIDHIRLAPEKAQSGPWIELCARDRRWRVRLGGAEWDCSYELRRGCHNAIYVAPNGKESLPANTDRPQRVLDHLVRLRVRAARAVFGAAMLLLSMCALTLVVVTAGLIRGRISFESPWGVVRCVLGFGIYLAFGYVLLSAAKKKREAAEQLARHVEDIREQGVYSE